MDRGFWVRVAAIWGLLAIAMGAFGAHGLTQRFTSLGAQPGGMSAARLQAAFHTAAQYHMYCALALLVVGVLTSAGQANTALQVAGWSILLGSLVFSGSLYLLSVTGLSWAGAITPVGGIGMMLGWLALAIAARPTSSQQ